MFVYEILEATSGELLSGSKEDNITEFTQDSRKVTNESMYIPLKGEKYDGHDFIDSAFDAGAKAIITSKDIVREDKIIIKVDDTLKALQDMASYLRLHRDVKVIGVTGSVGKTSTRDMIYSVVKQQYKTLKTEGNYNNNIGLPLTILRLQDEEVMILEMGMNHLKEISLLSNIAKPDISVITNVGTAHIGEVGSRENILKAKLEIVEGMQDHATLILNGDNDLLETVNFDNLNVVRVGLKSNNDLKPVNIKSNNEGSTFDINEIKETIHVPIIGDHFIINSLLAIEVGIKLNIDSSLIKKGIEEFKLTKNRMDILKLKQGITIIDGTYNASEDSMKSSLDVLSKYDGNRIAILADMLELGDYSSSLHSNVGKYVEQKGIDSLICVGNESIHICDGAIKSGMQSVYHFDTNQEVIDFLDQSLEKDDTILIKGSNGMKLKEIVKALETKY